MKTEAQADEDNALIAHLRARCVTLNEQVRIRDGVIDQLREQLDSRPVD